MSLEPLTDCSRFKGECEKILFRYQSNNFTTTVIRSATVCGYAPRQRLDLVGSDVKITNVKSDDNRSYHISSGKIRNILNFKSIFTVKEAIHDLKKAFQNNLLPNSLYDEKYFNIKKMQSIKLS